MPTYIRDSSRVPLLVDTALSAARREYPSHLTHLLDGPAEHLPPRALHPSFYGSFDWHSAVHTHWALLGLLRTVPNLPRAKEVRPRSPLARDVRRSYSPLQFTEHPSYMVSHWIVGFAVYRMTQRGLLTIRGRRRRAPSLS